MKADFVARKSPMFTFWSDDQCNMMHLAALEILERIGVRVLNAEAKQLLKAAGCLIKDDQVKIPGALVEEALRSVPRTVSFYNTDGKRAALLADRNINFAMCNDCPWFYDSSIGAIRKATMADSASAAKVADTLEHIDFVSSLSLASEVTIGLSDLYQYKSMRTWTKKPILGSSLDTPSTEALIEMAVVSAGGYEEFKNNPNYIIYCEPVSPLIHANEGIEKLLMCAEHSVPVIYAPAPLNGGTAPISTSGCYALCLAEALSGILIHQLKRKGAPIIMAGLAGPLDMKTTMALYADPVANQFNMATGAMGHFYNLPTYGMSGVSDSCVNDIQSAMECTFSVVISALSGMSIIHDNGYTGNGMIGNLETLIMDNEIIAMAKQYMRGIEVSDETIPVDLIEEVGPGGHYLLAEHTLKYFRTETYYPRYMNRKGYLLWQSDDGKDMGQKLKERVLTVLASDECNGVSGKELDELERIISREEKRVKNMA